MAAAVATVSTRAASPSALADTTAAMSAANDTSAALDARMRPEASGRSGLNWRSCRTSSRSLRLAAKANSPSETSAVAESAFHAGMW
jgi:hypothetical protein